MSSISTSSGEGSSRSRRRPLSMRCQARGFSLVICDPGWTAARLPDRATACEGRRGLCFDTPEIAGPCRKGAEPGFAGSGMLTKPLGAEKLRLATNPARLPFESTASLPEPGGPVGQDRAMRALHFGAGMAQPGFNIFVTGPQGSGKRNSVRRTLERLAAAMPPAPDIAYVFNFDQPHRPLALRFAAGDGAKFRAALIELVTALKAVMPRLFESEDYRAARDALEREFHDEAETSIDRLRRDAEAQGLALAERNGTFDFRPCRDGLAMSEEEFRNLSRSERERLAADTRVLRGQLEVTVARLEALRLATVDKIRALDRERGARAIGALLAPLAKRFTQNREAHAHLAAIYKDVLGQIDALQAAARGEGREAIPFHRYEANLVVDNGGARAAPVVTLGLPSLTNLVGRIEHVTVMMTVVTDFRHIRAGALHQANGGFLLIDALDLARQEVSWEALKRALKTRQVKIESLAEIHDRGSAVTLQPETVPLDIKIVLFGEAWVYQRLGQIDAEFAELFKVQADFSVAAPRNDANCTNLLAAMASLARSEGLKQLDRGGAARLIDEAARAAGDAEKISVRTGRLADLVREGDHYAALGGRTLISARDIAQAVAARDDRSGRLKALEHE